ncbi:hypothetical protein [Deinococcus radiophilus]|uniref:Uncharacterized protein n=1 Tax=Deinococcus radiophilus TaxID=32062 RepID=A0A431VMH3_9DEIO|nr:hypothetical protein [Deinococcus radiophilus]RTR23427.1 hypothetical protein EJ104_12455 [Deinococcus radiophilus]UFA50334.1 hypothetical protein LMT64_10790 [Deinococcus radiophilus]
MTDRQGIVFSLEGLPELEFLQVLRDVTSDPAFRRPLQIQAREPRPGQSAQLTLAFGPTDRELAFSAMQRLKTILLRYGVQVDSVVFPPQDAETSGLTAP